MEGFIKLLRCFFEWRWFRTPAVAHLFVYLLLRANYTDADWRNITVERGQLVTSQAKLAYETGLTESVVKRCIRTLRGTGEIKTKSTSQYTIITIIKYDDYQGVICRNDQESSNESPTVDQQKTTDKKYKNKRRQQPNSPQPPTGGDCSGDDCDAVISDDTASAADTPIGLIDTGYTGYSFCFVDPAFENAFYRWLRYRKEQFLFIYKSQDSLQACYNKLVKLAGNDPLKAMAIVEQSIANSWKGLFELNEENNGTNTQQPIGDLIRRDAAKAAEFSRQLDQERRANICSGDPTEVWEP